MRHAIVLALVGGSVWGHTVLAACPASAPGVAAASGERGVFVATAKADPLGETEDSQQLAIAEARLAARVMLKQDKAVPKTDDGRLRGVREVAVCLYGGSVFVTLRVSEIDMRRASALDAALQRSLQHSPVQR